MTEICKAAGCGAEIDFARTQAGKMMPVDRATAGQPGGTLAVWRGTDGDLYCRTLRTPAEELEPGEILGTSHYVTCNRPAVFRRRQG